MSEPLFEPTAVVKYHPLAPEQRFELAADGGERFIETIARDQPDDLRDVFRQRLRDRLGAEADKSAETGNQRR